MSRARALAGARPLPLAAATALGSPQDRAATALVGFHFHLFKPIDAPALAAVIARFCSLGAPEPHDTARGR